MVDRIVFYDGDCALCGGFVRWVAARDRGERLFFAPLQGETARRHGIVLSQEPAAWSLSFVAGRREYVRSDAALRAISELGGIWRLATVLLVVPRRVRDGVYRLIARNRPRDRCPLPSPQLERRLLP